MIVISFWIVCTVVSATRFWNRLLILSSNIVVCLISLCLLISTYSYTKVFFILHHRQSQIQDNVQQPNQINQLNIGRYKKAVSTAIWLQLSLVVCYLPCWVEAASRPSSTVPSASIYTVTLIFLNSSFNTILFLLEYSRSQTSSEGHHQTSALPLPVFRVRSCGPINVNVRSFREHSLQIKRVPYSC